MYNIVIRVVNFSSWGTKLEWCPIFDTSPLHQFSKFNNFLWVCWFLVKNLSNFVPPAWKRDNPYYHNVHLLQLFDCAELKGKVFDLEGVSKLLSLEYFFKLAFWLLSPVLVNILKHTVPFWKAVLILNNSSISLSSTRNSTAAKLKTDNNYESDSSISASLLCRTSSTSGWNINIRLSWIWTSNKICVSKCHSVHSRLAPFS